MTFLRAIIFSVLHVVNGRVAYDFSDGALAVLRTPLQESFSCESKAYGFYADVSNGCQVFHVCLPVLDALGDRISTDHFSFFCGNRTVFSQDSLQCVHEDEAYPCELSESIYEAANAKFGTAEGVAVFDEPLRESRQEAFQSINQQETQAFELDDAQENVISDDPQLPEVEEPFPQFIGAPETENSNFENTQISGSGIQENQEKTLDGSQGSDILDLGQGFEEPRDVFEKDGFQADNQGKDLSGIQEEQNSGLNNAQAVHVGNLDDQLSLPLELN